VLHPFLDLTPDGVLPIEESGIVKADEELAVGRVRIVGPRHRADPAHMRFGVEFGLEVGLVRSAHAGAVGAAALGHEARDHAVKLDPVIEPLVCQLDDPRDVAGGQIGAQLDLHIAAAAERKGKVLGHFRVTPAVCQPI